MSIGDVTVIVVGDEKVSYEEIQRPFGLYGCDGCAAINDRDLCKKLPLTCYAMESVFVMKLDEVEVTK